MATGDVTSGAAPPSASGVVRAVAAREPGRPVLEVHGTVHTYSELDAGSESVAQALQERSSASGHRHVVLFIEGTWALALASLAVSRSGLISVPVDPASPPDHLHRICKSVEPTVVLSDVRDLVVEGFDVIDPRALVGPRPTEWVDAPHPEYVSVAFTSGSTGDPKGIEVAPAQRPIGADGSDHSVFGSFSDGLRAGLLAAGSTAVSESTLQGFCALGATAVAFEVRRQGIAVFPAWIREARIFGFHAVPTLLRHLFGTLEQDEVIDGLSMIFLSGETTTWEDIASWFTHLPEHAVVISVYGTTETGPVLVFGVDRGTPSGSGPLPLGEPLPGRRVEIVDEAGAVVPQGEVGEIVVTGRETSLGYWQRPEETQTTFESVGPNLRRVHTGDLGRLLQDGNIEHHGRRDHLVKIAGNRVELGQVEAALRALDGVAEAAATTYRDRVGEVRLVAAVVAERDQSLSTSVLRRKLARRLPPAMLPDGIAVLGRLPLLSGGKIDRLRLPIADAVRREPGGIVAPRTDLEATLARLWSEVLGIEGISIDDDFFALGGDSLRAARVVVQLNHLYGYDLPVSTFVETPTIRDLAELLDVDAVDWSPLVVVRSEGSDPPLFIVHDGTGEVVFARLIAQEIPNETPIYGLRGQALNGGAIAEQSIEALASHYLDAVRRVRPEGPYSLYGMSAGGTVAFEMARQLRASGEQICVLALGDTPGPGGYEPAPPAPLSARAASRLAEVRERPPAEAVRHFATLLRRQLRFRAERVVSKGLGRDRRRRAQRFENEQKLAVAASGGTHVPLELRKDFALRTYGMLAMRYEPPNAYDGRLWILRARPSMSSAAAWQPYVEGAIEIVDIDGDHRAFGRHPVVERVGAALRAALQSQVETPA